MNKLIVIANPTDFTDIYEVTDEGFSHKVSHLNTPQESVEFVKNYSNSLQKKIKVIYKGPADYVRYFVSQANQFEFVKAEIGE